MQIRLCFSLLTASGINTAVLVQAADVGTKTQSETGYTPFVPSILQEPDIKVSKVPVGHAYIPADTVIAVRLENELSSKKAHKNDIIPMKTVDNIIINDVVVIPAGTEVHAFVVGARKNGLFGRSGKLEFSVDSVKTINNVTIPLEYIGEKKAGNDGGAIAVAAVVSVVGGLFMKGKNISFPAGTTFDAKVVADTDLKVSLDDLASAMDPNKPHGVSITLK